jgi:hypothetical protein
MKSPPVRPVPSLPFPPITWRTDGRRLGVRGHTDVTRDGDSLPIHSSQPVCRVVRDGVSQLGHRPRSIANGNGMAGPVRRRPWKLGRGSTGLTHCCSFRRRVSEVLVCRPKGSVGHLSLIIN